MADGYSALRRYFDRAQEHSMHLVRWLAAPVILVLSAHAFAAERPTAEELLAAYEKSVEKLARVHIEWSRVDAEQAEGKATDQYTLFRDGSRWKLDRYWPGWGDGRRLDNRFREQTLVGDEVLSAAQHARAPNFQYGRPIVACQRGEGAPNPFVPSIGMCRILFGRMGGDAGYPLWTIMREAGSLDLLPQTEAVDGVETYVLMSTGKYGEHKVWLDPASGALPRRIEVHKRAGNLFDQKQLGTILPPDTGTARPPREPGSGPTWRETFVRIEKIQIQSKGDAFVVAGFEEFSENIHSTGKKQESRTGFKPRVLEVNPQDFPANAFQFDIEIPNGTLVSVREAKQERYNSDFHWEDGKVLPGRGK
jgi:hypothetical protein